MPKRGAKSSGAAAAAAAAAAAGAAPARVADIAEKENAAYDVLLGKYNALVAEQQQHSKAVREQIESLLAHDKTQKENELLKSEVVALHERVRSLERALEGRPSATPAFEQTPEAGAVALQAQTTSAVASGEEAKGASAGSGESRTASSLVLQFYQLLTTSLVTATGENCVRVRTVNRKAKRLLEFDLAFTDEEDELQYSPVRMELGGLQVPPFLAENISFSVSEAPNFFKVLLATAHQP